MRRGRKRIEDADNKDAVTPNRNFNKSRSPVRKQPIARAEVSKYSENLFTTEGMTFSLLILIFNFFFYFSCKLLCKYDIEITLFNNNDKIAIHSTL